MPHVPDDHRQQAKQRHENGHIEARCGEPPSPPRRAGHPEQKRDRDQTRLIFRTEREGQRAPPGHPERQSRGFRRRDANQNEQGRQREDIKGRIRQDEDPRECERRGQCAKAGSPKARARAAQFAADQKEKPDAQRAQEQRGHTVGKRRVGPQFLGDGGQPEAKRRMVEKAEREASPHGDGISLVRDDRRDGREDHPSDQRRPEDEPEHARDRQVSAGGDCHGARQKTIGPADTTADAAARGARMPPALVNRLTNLAAMISMATPERTTCDDDPRRRNAPGQPPCDRSGIRESAGAVHLASPRRKHSEPR